MNLRLYRHHFRKTAFLSLPIIASRAGAQLLFMLNLAMVGRAGAWILLSALATTAFLLVSRSHAGGRTELETHRVLTVLALGSPAFIGYFFVSGILEAFGKARPAALATAAGFAFNSLLNIKLLSHFSDDSRAAVWVAVSMIAVRWGRGIPANRLAFGLLRHDFRAA